MTLTTTSSEANSVNVTNLIESYIICLFIFAISTIFFLIAIIYQLWSTNKFWEVPSSLILVIVGIVGYAMVFWLIFKSVSQIGTEMIYNKIFIAFVIIVINAGVFLTPGLGINALAVIIPELIVGFILYLIHKTWNRSKLA